MDVDLIYDEETTKNILKYETLLTKYETRLRELIDKTPNLDYSTRQELFNDDRGRKSIIQVITNLKRTIPEDIFIVGENLLIGR